MKIHMILLAAGNSRRFGGNKLLSSMNGKPMYRYLTDRLERLTFEGAGKKLIVSQYDSILEELGGRGWLGVRNQNPEEGISRSIRLGIENLKRHGAEKTDAVCFFVCDQPYLERETIEKFFRAYEIQKKGIGCMGSGEKLGNPVIFQMKYMEELLALRKDVGGKKVLKSHPDDVFVFQAEARELVDIDYRKRPLVVVRGGGDIATGTICRLYREGYRLLVLETEKPAAIRRQVAFSEAVYDGETEVEGVYAVRIRDTGELGKVWEEGRIPVLTDPECRSLERLCPDVVVDAILAKKNLGMRKDMAPLTIALGPGFEAGVDADAVVETMRGETLGKIFYKGTALPNTGIPGMIGGYAAERVIHAPASGRLKVVCHVGEEVKKGEVLAYVGNVPVFATIPGILRGLIREGFEVTEGLKIIDIDPRVSETANCFLISDKAKRIAASVYEVIRNWENQHSSGNCSTLYEALGLDFKRHRVISFVGAGGKTTTIYTLAEELKALGFSVAVTTTTHMKRPGRHYCEWGEAFSFREQKVLTVGRSCGDGKITAPEEHIIPFLRDRADFVLVEADGSRGKPLKVPAAHEPVIPEETDLVVGILGLHGRGKKISEAAHRVKDVCAFLGKEPEDVVTEEDLEKISFSEKGLLKNVTVPYRILWNRAK